MCRVGGLSLTLFFFVFFFRSLLKRLHPVRPCFGTWKVTGRRMCLSPAPRVQRHAGTQAGTQEMDGTGTWEMGQDRLKREGGLEDSIKAGRDVMGYLGRGTRERKHVVHAFRLLRPERERERVVGSGRLRSNQSNGTHSLTDT
ncbi:hypothetical protein LZ31DRAFT_161994 [Colletotrichum somersetense]|nr:hypothetical protein LZ31DRAFT_161994 [Colletotrichum somersetense]